MSGDVSQMTGGDITLLSMGAPPLPTSPTARLHHHYYHFSIKHLNTLCATVVLAFFTIVPLLDIAFAVLLLSDLLVLSQLAFSQRLSKTNPAEPIFQAHHGGVIIGVALPAL